MNITAESSPLATVGKGSSPRAGDCKAGSCSKKAESRANRRQCLGSRAAFERTKGSRQYNILQFHVPDQSERNLDQQDGIAALFPTEPMPGSNSREARRNRRISTTCPGKKKGLWQTWPAESSGRTTVPELSSSTAASPCLRRLVSKRRNETTKTTATPRPSHPRHG